MDALLDIKKYYVRDLVEQGKRMDGRKFDEYRPINIDVNAIPNANGSAKVTLGDTIVYAGVKLDVGQPYPDTPNEGVFMVGTEFSPIADKDFYSGPPTPQAIEVGRVVDRGIRSAEIVDTEKLCIEPGESVWMAFVDLHVVSNDGNLIDASALAAMAALKSAWVPKYEDGSIVREKAMDFPISGDVVELTYSKISNNYILDLTKIEEAASEGRITFGADGKNVYSTQLAESLHVGSDELLDLLDAAMKKSKDLLSLLR